MMRLKSFCLGKKARRIDRRTLRLSKYIRALAPPPTNAGYITEVTNWPMMLNDSLGDCTVACAGHMIEQWTTYAGSPFTPTDTEILDAYEAVSGYSPDKPDSDNGAVILDVLNYWRKTGIGGDKIAAYVAVDPTNHVEIEQAVALFGNCYIGVGLPITAQNPIQGFNGNPCWSMPEGGPVGDGAPYSWGGHAIPIVGYGIDGEGNKGVEIVTWGQIYDATWGFLSLYCDEAYAVLSQDWIEKDKQSPSGFDVAQLQSDLTQL
jgi:hypothetical protein